MEILACPYYRRVTVAIWQVQSAFKHIHTDIRHVYCDRSCSSYKLFLFVILLNWVKWILPFVIDYGAHTASSPVATGDYFLYSKAADADQSPVIFVALMKREWKFLRGCQGSNLYSVKHFFFLWLYSPNQALAASMKLSVSPHLTRSRTDGRTPLTGDQLVARPLPVHIHRKTHTQHKH
jgi:hypothetical protein